MASVFGPSCLISGPTASRFDGLRLDQNAAHHTLT